MRKGNAWIQRLAIEIFAQQKTVIFVHHFLLESDEPRSKYRVARQSANRRRPSGEIIRPLAVIRLDRRRTIIGGNSIRRNVIFFENFAVPVLPGYRICFHSGVVCNRLGAECRPIFRLAGHRLGSRPPTAEHIAGSIGARLSCAGMRRDFSVRYARDVDHCPVLVLPCDVVVTRPSGVGCGVGSLAGNIGDCCVPAGENILVLFVRRTLRRLASV